MGNQELLAIKVALEEWRRWLGGAEHPFLVWTDHKNLEYLQIAKRLNPCQAKWALFFGCFNFSLSYHPSSKNMKPDALSYVFDPDSAPESSTYILPSSCVVGAVTWGIKERVKQASVNIQVLDDCPPNQLFVPSSLHSQVFHLSPLLPLVGEADFLWTSSQAYPPPEGNITILCPNCFPLRKGCAVPFFLFTWFPQGWG